MSFALNLETKDIGLPEQRSVSTEVPCNPGTPFLRWDPEVGGCRPGGLHCGGKVTQETHLSHLHSPPGHTGTPAGPQVRRALHVGEKELKVLMELAPRDLLAGYGGVRGC